MSEEQSTPLSDEKSQGQDKTRPTDPANVSEAGGPLPDPDEGPGPEPVDEIQDALLNAARSGAAAEVDFDDLPPPGVSELAGEETSAGEDDAPQSFSETAQPGAGADIDFDDLPEPVPDLDEGPSPGPVDEIQGALFEAARQGAPAEVDFEALPEPGKAPPTTRKVIRFKSRTEPVVAEQTQPGPETEPVSAPARADFWRLLALFMSFRFLTLLLLKPGGFLRDWSDFDTYLGIAGLSDYGLYPYLDFWLEWPPLMPWLTVGAYKLSLLLPPWPDDPRFWFIAILGSVFVLFEVGNFVLVYRLARRLFGEPGVATRVLWFYAGLFPPVYAMLGFFDGAALFFMLLALELLLGERRMPSAMAAGVGFMVKIIPVLILPVALRRIWFRHEQNKREAGVEMGLYAVVFGLTVLLLLAPFLLGGPEWVMASARSMVGRSSWETIWAVLEGYYGFGLVEGERLNPAETNFAAHPGWLPWWMVTIIFAGIYGFLFTRKADYSRARPLAAFAGLTVTIFLLYSKGYSPQFLVYLLPFVVLLFPDGRGLVYALTLTGLNVLEQPVYFVLLPEATWLLSFVVIARFLLLILLALEFALVIWPAEEKLARVAALRSRAPLAVGGLAILALAALTPLILRTYFGDRLVGTSLGGFVGFMEVQAEEAEAADPGAGAPHLLVSDQETYRQIYPHLRRAFQVQLVGGDSLYEGLPRISSYLQGLDTVWILPAGQQEQRLTTAASDRGERLASFDFTGLGTVSHYTFRNASPFMPEARFSTGIELLAHEVEARRGAIDVALYWRTRDPVNQNFVVFTHLLNADGEWVEGHDSIPMNGAAPTNEWSVDAVQADLHRIPLPAGLPAGEYTVVAGMYLRGNPEARLAAAAPDGSPLPNQAVRLVEDLRLP